MLRMVLVVNMMSVFRMVNLVLPVELLRMPGGAGIGVSEPLDASARRRLESKAEGV